MSSTPSLDYKFAQTNQKFDEFSQLVDKHLSENLYDIITTLIPRVIPETSFPDSRDEREYNKKFIFVGRSMLPSAFYNEQELRIFHYYFKLFVKNNPLNFVENTL